ncbi:hypothetical protein F5884DRAFT_852325 [Xylogone sp. PMI_703]|nr:hypothetical protein F5884DRAFT_852325 [Xylogone sp. PMI_703]
MTAARNGPEPLKLDVPESQIAPDFPPISSLFLIYFDIKAGYTVAWKRALPGVEVEGVVEYKSLPSGLHTVSEDLIYFIHESHAGLSAFINAPADEESRNARMIAVGIMVPLSYGRLGRSWKHADMLKKMARELIVDTSNTKILEDFWEEHKSTESVISRESDSALLDSPSFLSIQPTHSSQSKPKHGRNRLASDGTALLPPGHNLSSYHPAWSLPHLLDTFGPLIFPLHRAALLRKRILIIGHAPVHETCNFVYDISVLSNIPLAVCDLLSPSAPPQKLKPLFSIGVHDIPFLGEELRGGKASATTLDSDAETAGEKDQGWIACTTDSILAMKKSLYDVLISMPPPYSEGAKEKVWPKIESPQGIEMKATQRDLRRYKALRWALSCRSSPPSPGAESSTRPRPTSSASTIRTHDDPLLDLPETDSLIEPLSWSALAYSGFMWWASAGERRLQTDEEAESDAILLTGLNLAQPLQISGKSTTSISSIRTTDSPAQQEMAIIAYFHRMTTQILSILSDIIDSADSDDDREDQALSPGSGETSEEEQGGPAVYVGSTDIARMGLDVWSASDKLFIEAIAQEYFGVRAQVEGRNIDICGIKIC